MKERYPTMSDLARAAFWKGVVTGIAAAFAISIVMTWLFST